MNINLLDHRRALYERQKVRTWRRSVLATVLGFVFSILTAGWWQLQRQVWEPEWQAAQHLSQQLKSQQASWVEQKRVWSEWEAQRQVWLGLADKSQVPLRIWHWLGTASAHGVRWTHWQQDGLRWTVSGEARSLMDVQQWVVSGRFKPIPMDREVEVSQSYQKEDGKIGFLLTWEDLP